MHPDFALDSYAYDLPSTQIAQAPASPRDASRMLVCGRADGALVHRAFLDLPGLLRAGDVLVANHTKVMPARLAWRRADDKKGELLLHRPLDGPLETATTWEGIGRPGAALKPGRQIETLGGTRLEVVARRGIMIEVRGDGPLWPVMCAEGSLPLPPYLAERDDAADVYQTLFAEQSGAVAASTAALHFTPRVVAALEARGVALLPLVLHVGPGTFLPMRPDVGADVRQHAMHREPYAIPASTLATLAARRAAGGRVVAVGTTVVRALETYAQSGQAHGDSELFITPGFPFRMVDALLTNFHLPRTTLLLLVAALAGRERLLAAYREAVASGYRFYSLGDAMLVL